MDASMREELINARIIQLSNNPYYEGADEAALRQFATELVDDEIAFEFLLDDDEIIAVRDTLFKAERFLRAGKRHITMAFFPDQRIIALNAKALAVTIRYMERHTFTLHKRDITANHSNCSCHPGTIRLVWQRDSKQLIYTY